MAHAATSGLRRRETRVLDADHLLDSGIDLDASYMRDGWALADGQPNPRMLTTHAAALARVWHANAVLPPDALRLIAALARRAGLFFADGDWTAPLPQGLRDLLRDLPHALTHEIIAAWCIAATPTLRRWADLRGVVAHLDAVHRLLRLELALAAMPRVRAMGFGSYERWLIEEDPGYQALRETLTAVTKR